MFTLVPTEHSIQEVHRSRIPRPIFAMRIDTLCLRAMTQALAATNASQTVSNESHLKQIIHDD